MNPEQRALRILIVEDNLINQKVLRSVMETAGYDTDVAGDGAEGLQKFETESYDLILMDIQMPVMDGLECTRRIRTHEESQGGHIPIIAVTAFTSEENRNNCADAGMDDFIAKPIQKEDLLNKVQRLCASRSEN